MPHFHSHDGLRLSYTVLGEGPTLICLPGGPGADATSQGDLGGLTAHHTLVRLDMRAGGDSDIPADQASCAFPEQARDIEALRVHLALDTIDLLAHSAASLSAQAYAAAYPERLRKLVLVTPAGRAARERDEDEVARIQARGTITKEPGDNGSPPEWLRGAYYVDRAPVTVRQPVLAVAGAEDGIGGVAPARSVADFHPAGVLAVLPGAGHWPWLDVPETFTSVVSGFLEAELSGSR
ncbi:pimeloyl-ACP methyl ester carboxylesterase [Crossiella equi]|uniref:Pimeloyl-ACP methyl ester carboxylesterase n=1 Tax=Crossiella equi TaxID=130796 RepID=A0ABS5A4W8_9PSEU|nr:alpha/beta hydrolase [Crossiella equi]MBP2471287.1 pimeloyl-ACP methyl ester carboxylesterase [Crossiella equi]